MHISSKFEESPVRAPSYSHFYLPWSFYFDDLAEHLCFRILGPLHVAIITRSGQRSRKTGCSSASCIALWLCTVCL